MYRTCVGAGPRQIAAAALSGLGLSHTVGVAVIAGLFTKDKPFLRTPKQAPRHALLQALVSAREEWLMTIALLLAAWGVSEIDLMGSPDLAVWIIVLIIQTVPYLAAIVMSLVSALPLPASLVGLPTPTRHQASNTVGAASAAAHAIGTNEMPSDDDVAAEAAPTSRS